ncbi:MAG: hypothetical protein LBV32_09485 [Tannerellaceae bacterium]|jgi:hypothetical protein|nr:hypothetical protein [Tannerellaceae bacterium]
MNACLFPAFFSPAYNLKHRGKEIRFFYYSDNEQNKKFRIRCASVFNPPLHGVKNEKPAKKERKRSFSTLFFAFRRLKKTKNEKKRNCGCRKAVKQRESVV